MGVLRHWRYCPRCRAELTHHGGKVECSQCGFVQYANPVPAVAALVLDGDRVLLARRAFEPEAGLWDTPGGFLDEGESPEDGLRRELLEEAGIAVEVGDFFGMCLDRYGPGDDRPWVLSLVWRAAVSGGEPRAADDVSELRWFSRDALPPAEELAFTWLESALRRWAEDARA